jgi:hypothetical protein
MTSFTGDEQQLVHTGAMPVRGGRSAKQSRNMRVRVLASAATKKVRVAVAVRIVPV